MRRTKLLTWFFGITLLASFPLVSRAQELPPPPDEGYDYGEELLRGPVHEAFAEQYNQEAVEPFVVDRAPPAAITEVPPQLKPTGERVEWVPGYWFWDDDRSDFIWISGIWRNIPPGVRWVPGYWDGSSGRHRWVAGTWVAVDQNEIDYLAQAPPTSLDYGPVGVAPSTNHFWIPGCWNWRDTTYAWRPGYWSAGYSDWVWMPERYLWTPSGYVFCRGYWDYPITNRGVLFAPFWFQRPAYVTTGFRYTPRISLLSSALQSHFWVRPISRHYYFGDFYGSRYRSRGIHPWHSFAGGGFRHSGSHGGGAWGLTRGGYDPLFSHHHRTSSGRSTYDFRQTRDRYQDLVDHADRRPPATYRDLRRGHSRSDAERFADAYQDRGRRDPSRYTRLSDSQWQEYRGRAADTPALASLRRERETRGHDRHRVERKPGDAVNAARPGDRGPGPRNGETRSESFRLPPDRTRGDGRRPRGDRDNDREVVAQPGSGGNERPSVQIPSRPFPRQGRPETGRPEGGRPVIGRPETGRPETGRPVVGRPVVERPEAGRPEAGRPVIGRPETSRPETSRPETSRPETGRPVIGRPETIAPGGNSPRIRPADGRPSVNRPSANNPPRFDRGGGRPTANDRPAMGAARPTAKPEATAPQLRGPERPAGARPTGAAPRSGRPTLESAGPRRVDAVAPSGPTRPSATRPSAARPGNLSPQSQRSQRPSLEVSPRPQATAPGLRAPSVAKPSAPAQASSRPFGSRSGRDLTPARSAPRVAPIAKASAVEAPRAPRREASTGNRAGASPRGNAGARPDGDASRRAPRAAPSAPRREAAASVRKPTASAPKAERGNGGSRGNRPEGSGGRRGRGGERGGKP